jgi:bacterioferritin-associated ferredoxin
MYVCVCRAVTERQIRQAVQGGARSLKDLKQLLDVGRECGLCAPCARTCIEEARHAQETPGRGVDRPA